MSYCRWSSDNFQCDLYCYEHVNGGWITFVSDSRLVPKQGGDLGNPLAAPREPIGLAHDGESFSDSTLEAFRARLVMLREAGYRFPDHVLERVDAEIAESAP